jgi:tRNA (cmo5U34)-methyltransferase
LGVDSGEYDAAIRRFIPGYDEMIATVVRWLDGHLPPDALVVDLGAGTGALALAVLEALPDVRVQLVDVDPAMLEVAAARCAAYEGRVELRRASFADPMPRCHAVVASLALHHVFELEDKQTLYRRIHEALLPGGVLLIADCAVHDDGPERQRVFAEFSAAMQKHGISADEAAAHFAQWAEEDRYYPLATELATLAEAGFPRPECFWRQGPMAVFGGFC